MEQLNMFGCETAYRSSRITKQTRRESHSAVNKNKLYSLILEQLKYQDMTAREIAVVLYRHGLVLTPARQQVQPRLTELVQDGRVEVVGKRLDTLTGKHVAVYRLVVEDEEKENNERI